MLRADAIVLLGCRIAPSGLLSGAAARRMATAALAFHRGVAGTIIASGGRRWGSAVEARSLHQGLVLAGVPDEAIVDELFSFSTCENAIFSAALLRRLPRVTAAASPRAAIVTCPWHMPRALQSFHAAGIDAFGVPTEAAPAPLQSHAYRLGHEIVCRWFDAWTMRRSSVLAESAGAYFRAPPTDPTEAA